MKKFEIGKNTILTRVDQGRLRSWHRTWRLKQDDTETQVNKNHAKKLNANTNQEYDPAAEHSEDGAELPLKGEALAAFSDEVESGMGGYDDNDDGLISFPEFMVNQVKRVEKEGKNSLAAQGELWTVSRMLCDGVVLDW